MFWPCVSLWYFGGSFVLVAFLFGGEWLLPQLQRVHLPPSLQTNFLNTSAVLIFERLASVRLRRLKECRGVLPTTQFAYRKRLGTCDALLCVAHTFQSALEMDQKARIVQIDFSAAFADNHQGILFKLCSVAVGCSVLSVLTVFL